MNEIRNSIYEEKCSLCGYDIEMKSYIVDQNEEKYNIVSHLSCYLERVSKVSLELKEKEDFY